MNSASRSRSIKSTPIPRTSTRRSRKAARARTTRAAPLVCMGPIPREDGSPPSNWQSVFGGPAWTWDARRRRYYMHNFSLSSQPQINAHNPRRCRRRCWALTAVLAGPGRGRLPRRCAQFPDARSGDAGRSRPRPMMAAAAPARSIISSRSTTSRTPISCSSFSGCAGYATTTARCSRWPKWAGTLPRPR